MYFYFNQADCGNVSRTICTLQEMFIFKIEVNARTMGWVGWFEHACRQTWLVQINSMQLIATVP